MIKSTKQLSDFIQSPGSMLRCTVLIVSLLLSMALCSTASDAGIRPSALVTDPPEPDPVPQLDSNLKLIPLTDALNDLNTRLLHRLSTNNHENSVYSPIAIAIPLAMVLSGARNRTQRELWQALGLTNVYSTPVELSQAFRSLLDSYKKLEQTPNERNALLNIAMLGIYSNDFKVRKSFRFNLLNNFYTPLAKTNFSVFGQETLDSVNRWVNTKTHGRVKQILTAPLQPDTRLVLMTAFAFRADWLHEFERRLFIDREFHNADGSISRLPLMFRRGSYRYVATPNHSQLIELPYHGDFAMYILLPDKSMSLPALLGQLSGRKLDTMQSQMQNTSVELFLPRFRVEFGLQLVPVLQDMGVKRAFGPNADFSGISSSGQAYISTALHQAFVEVNEKGTEAVAATVIGVSIKSGGYATKMLVDRPFAFIIKDLQNNLDLFSGIITKL